MAGRKSSILVAFFLLLITMEVAVAQAQGNDNSKGNENGNGNGKDKGGKEDKNKGKGKDKEKNQKKAPHDAASTHYEMLSPLPSGQERAFCHARGSCYYKTLVCPSECTNRKPKKNKKNKKHKGCFIDCSSKCEATCKCKFTSIHISFPLIGTILTLSLHLKFYFWLNR